MSPSSFHWLVRLPLLSLLVAIALMGVISKRGWSDWRRMARQNGELRARVETVRAEKADLETRVAQLKSDPAEQERVVRETLGYLKADETLIEFP